MQIFKKMILKEGSVYSYTKAKEYKMRVSKKYISKEDNILIVDDFLSNEQAISGLKEIIDAASAKWITPDWKSI